MLEKIIEHIIENIREDRREAGDVYPPMAHVAAKRVLLLFNFSSRLNIDRIWYEAAAYEQEHHVFADSGRFICASLPDVLGEFVKHKMGSEYQRLFDDRMALLTPAGADAE